MVPCSQNAFPLSRTHTLRTPTRPSSPNSDVPCSLEPLGSPELTPPLPWSRSFAPKSPVRRRLAESRRHGHAAHGPCPAPSLSVRSCQIHPSVDRRLTSRAGEGLCELSTKEGNGGCKAPGTANGDRGCVCRVAFQRAHHGCLSSPIESAPNTGLCLSPVHREGRAHESHANKRILCNKLRSCFI